LQPSGPGGRTTPYVCWVGLSFAGLSAAPNKQVEAPPSIDTTFGNYIYMILSLPLATMETVIQKYEKKFTE